MRILFSGTTLPSRYEAVCRALEALGHSIIRNTYHSLKVERVDARVMQFGPDSMRDIEEYHADPRPTLVLVNTAQDELDIIRLLRVRDDTCRIDESPDIIAARLQRVVERDGLVGGDPEQWRRGIPPGYESAALLFDIDHFTNINRRIGFKGGDRMLEVLVKRLTTSCEPHDRVTLGDGDDIHLLLARATREALISDASNARESACARPIFVDGNEVQFTLSAGMAFVDDNVGSSIQQASLALVMAKDAGRNELILYDSMRDGTVDALTGVHNRRYFDMRLARELRRALLDDAPLTLAMLDLDDFGMINKTYGHTAGDKVLRRFAAVVMGHVRTTDWLARYGGEEFCLILHAPRNEATLIAERIRTAVASEAVQLGSDRSVSVTVSIGLTISTASDVDVDMIVSRASQANRRAKQEGKNRTSVAEH